MRLAADLAEQVEVVERPRTAERVEFEVAFEARVGALRRGRKMVVVVAAWA